MEYTKLNEEDGNGRIALSVTNNVPTLGGTTIDWSKWKLKIIVIIALTLLTSSQSILIVWSKRNGKYNYSITSSNFMYYILEHVEAPGYQILKKLNVISTGVLYRIILKKKLSYIQWAALILLCFGCSISQMKPSSDVFQTPAQGWVMAIVMALLSGLAGVYTEVYSTSVAMLFTTFVSYYLFAFDISYAFIFGTAVVIVSVYLYTIGK